LNVDLTGSVNVMVDSGSGVKWSEDLVLRPGQQANVMLKTLRKNEDMDIELNLDLNKSPVPATQEVS
jgi:hypothetical protein